MILFVCVDDRFGLLFNQRRQSRDSAVIDRIIEMSAGKRLWMDPYSAVLFPSSVQICSDKDFLMKASNDDCCFVELVDVKQYLKLAEKIVLFQWNRRYPADLYFPMTILDSDWKLVATCDFSGSSHERITMKVYEH